MFLWMVCFLVILYPAFVVYCARSAANICSPSIYTYSIFLRLRLLLVAFLVYIHVSNQNSELSHLTGASTDSGRL